MPNNIKSKRTLHNLADFLRIIEQAKEVMAEENISFDEIERNTGVDAQFCRVLFDDATKTAQNINTILNFLKISMKSRKLYFQTYDVRGEGSSMRIRRSKIPKCTMYYDRNKDEFYRFKYDLRSPENEMYTNIIKNEMRDTLYRYLDGERR